MLRLIIFLLTLSHVFGGATKKGEKKGHPVNEHMRFRPMTRETVRPLPKKYPKLERSENPVKMLQACVQTLNPDLASSSPEPFHGCESSVDELFEKYQKYVLSMINVFKVHTTTFFEWNRAQLTKSPSDPLGVEYTKGLLNEALTLLEAILASLRPLVQNDPLMRTEAGSIDAKIRAVTEENEDSISRLTEILGSISNDVVHLQTLYGREVYNSFLQDYIALVKNHLAQMKVHFYQTVSFRFSINNPPLTAIDRLFVHLEAVLGDLEHSRITIPDRIITRFLGSYYQQCASSLLNHLQQFKGAIEGEVRKFKANLTHLDDPNLLDQQEINDHVLKSCLTNRYGDLLIMFGHVKSLHYRYQLAKRVLRAVDETLDARVTKIHAALIANGGAFFKFKVSLPSHFQRCLTVPSVAKK